MKKVIPEDSVLVPTKAKKVFSGQIFDVYQWPQSMFDGTLATFEMLKRPDTVTVIGIVGDKIIVIDDEQPHSGARMSFPGGRVDETDTSILQAAKREMMEETGYEFQQWRLVRVWQPHTKLEWFIHFFIAWHGQKMSEPHLDAGEKISLELLPFSQVKDLVITKSGYLAESKELLEPINDFNELKSLAKFVGQEVDR